MMEVEKAGVRPKMGWGTWEELVLGSAVLRHGTRDWNVVASELRARSVSPYSITPQVCKAKYEDLLQRYSGSRAWFEELRKQRVMELKLELARSENSIGSLESKIKTLEAEKQHSNHAECSSSQAESAIPLYSHGTESCGKETSKDEYSAGSFTRDTRSKPGISNSASRDEHEIVNKVIDDCIVQGLTIRKPRGQRRRKDCGGAFKEVSVGESENFDSSNIGSTSQKEATADDFGEIIMQTNPDDQGKTSCSTGGNDLMEIFDAIAQTDPASVFRHRMDSQKRARYRKIIRQHVDIGTIRLRISRQLIKSVKELFSDLLLLANNALVFYSRRTREYKSACALRDLVKKEYKQHCRGSCQESVSSFLQCNPPVKPRSARPRPPLCKNRTLAVPGKLSIAKNAVQPTKENREKSCDFDTNVLLQSLLNDKKGLKRPGKVKSVSTDVRSVKQRNRKGG